MELNFTINESAAMFRCECNGLSTTASTPSEAIGVWMLTHGQHYKLCTFKEGAPIVGEEEHPVMLEVAKTPRPQVELPPLVCVKCKSDRGFSLSINHGRHTARLRCKSCHHEGPEVSYTPEETLAERTGRATTAYRQSA